MQPTVNSLSSVLTAIFRGRPGLASTRMSPFWIFGGVKGDGGNWSYIYIAIEAIDVQSSNQIVTTTNQHSTFYRPDALPVTKPTVNYSCHTDIYATQNLLKCQSAKNRSNKKKKWDVDKVSMPLTEEISDWSMLISSTRKRLQCIRCYEKL